MLRFSLTFLSNTRVRVSTRAPPICCSNPLFARGVQSVEGCLKGTEASKRRGPTKLKQTLVHIAVSCLIKSHQEVS